MKYIGVTMAVAAALMASSLRAAEEVAASRLRGQAEVSSSLERDRLDSRSVTIPVTIDLSTVFADGTPVVLGAYVARVTFDPQRVAFVRATTGPSSEFAAASLLTTDRARANKDGVVRLAAVQTGEFAPAGRVDVARLAFRELEPGGADSIEVFVDSVASALQRRAGEFEQYSVPVVTRR